jgi:hypothetical protein
MKMRYLLLLNIFVFSNVLASQKYLVCTGNTSMSTNNVEDGTKNLTRNEELRPWEASKVFIIKKGKLYDADIEEISGCSVTLTSIKCRQDLKKSWAPGFETAYYLDINRINGAIKEINISHQKYITDASTNAIEITRTRFDGYCELKENVKF